jgi:hypothetical protein
VFWDILENKTTAKIVKINKTSVFFITFSFRELFKMRCKLGKDAAGSKQFFRELSQREGVIFRRT